MWRRNRPIPAPFVSAIEALAMLRAGHQLQTVLTLVPAGVERRRFEQSLAEREVAR